MAKPKAVGFWFDDLSENDKATLSHAFQRWQACSFGNMFSGLGSGWNFWRYFGPYQVAFHETVRHELVASGGLFEVRRTLGLSLADIPFRQSNHRFLGLYFRLKLCYDASRSPRLSGLARQVAFSGIRSGMSLEARYSVESQVPSSTGRRLQGSRKQELSSKRKS